MHENLTSNSLHTATKGTLILTNIIMNDEDIFTIDEASHQKHKIIKSLRLGQKPWYQMELHLWSNTSDLEQPVMSPS